MTRQSLETIGNKDSHFREPGSVDDDSQNGIRQNAPCDACNLPTHPEDNGLTSSCSFRGTQHTAHGLASNPQIPGRTEHEACIFVTQTPEFSIPGSTVSYLAQNTLPWNLPTCLEASSSSSSPHEPFWWQLYYASTSHFSSAASLTPQASYQQVSGTPKEPTTPLYIIMTKDGHIMIGKYAINRARKGKGDARPMSAFQAHVSSIVKVYNGSDSEALLVGTIRAGTLARFSGTFRDQNPIPTSNAIGDVPIAKPPTEFIVTLDAPQMPTLRAVEHTLKWMKANEIGRGTLTPVFTWDGETPLTDLLDVYATLRAFGLHPFPKQLKVELFDRISKAPPTLEMFKAVTQYVPLADSIVTRIITAMVDYGDRNAYFVSDIDAMEGYMYKEGPPGLVERFDAIWQARHQPYRFHGGKFHRTGPRPLYTPTKGVTQEDTKPAVSTRQSAASSPRSSNLKSITTSSNGISKSASTASKQTPTDTPSSTSLASSNPTTVPKPQAADSAIGTTSTSPAPAASLASPALADPIAGSAIEKAKYSEAAKTPQPTASVAEVPASKAAPTKSMQVLTTKPAKTHGEGVGSSAAIAADKAVSKDMAKDKSHPGLPQRRRRLRRKVTAAE